jgi:hypothetical protein
MAGYGPMLGEVRDDVDTERPEVAIDRRDPFRSRE